MRRFVVVMLLFLALGSALLLRPGAFRLEARSFTFTSAISSAKDGAERGAVIFAFGDWGALSTDTLQTSAVPWKLANAALALQATDGDAEAAGQADLAAIWREFGFLTPDVIGNWPDGLPQPDMPVPLGQNHGQDAQVFPPIGLTIGNIGCAACHASVMYDAEGRPNPRRVWLGMPNSSINLEAYTQALFSAVKVQGRDAGKLLAVVEALYPDTDWREKLTLRRVVLPAFLTLIAERETEFGGPLPFRVSLAGATNGLDSLRNRLGLLPPGELVTESAFNSVPDLGGRLWRTSLLNTGGYLVAGQDHTRPMTAEDLSPAHRADLAAIIAFFTVPSMGVTQEVAQRHSPDAVAVTAWMEGYAAQPFPGSIDRGLLPQGQAVYAQACAACHGVYDDSLTQPRLVSFPNWTGDIGTDPDRARLSTPALVDAVNNGLFGQYINARTTTTYAAPPLAGIWVSAPYLHNGSVPTLWHLMRPALRPRTFEVGGHKLDLATVGLDLEPPADYVPWSQPVTVDTTLFGLSNAGHEVGFAGLSKTGMKTLLEYLKLL